MATNNSINKTSDTFVATASMASPLITASQSTGSDPTLRIGKNGFAHYSTLFTADGTSYYSDSNNPADVAFFRSAAGKMRISDAALTGSATLEVNTLSSLSGNNLTLSTVQPGTHVNINAGGGINLTSVQDVNLSPATAVTNIAGKLAVTSTGLGQYFLEGRAPSDSMPRAALFQTTGVTGILLGTGAGTDSYLTFLGVSGTLTISPNSDGTGAGTLNTNAGIVKAATFSNGTPNLALNSGAVTATLTANSLTVNNAGAGNLTLGNTSSGTGSTTPVTINMGNSTSNVAGQYLKIKTYDDGIEIYGIGVSPSQQDYMVSSGKSHAFWQGATKTMWLDGSNILNLQTGLKLPSSGATASTLNFYANGTHNTTWTGPWASSQTANIKYERNGTIVTLTIPVMSAATNSTNAITIVNALPTYLRPTTNHIESIFVVNNSATSAGNAIVQSNGVIIIANGTGGTFTNSGTAGLVMSISITYQVN